MQYQEILIGSKKNNIQIKYLKKKKKKLITLASHKKEDLRQKTKR